MVTKALEGKALKNVVVVGKAGTGKTNVMKHIAQSFTQFPNIDVQFLQTKEEAMKIKKVKTQTINAESFAEFIQKLVEKQEKEAKKAEKPAKKEKGEKKAKKEEKKLLILIDDFDSMKLSKTTLAQIEALIDSGKVHFIMAAIKMKDLNEKFELVLTTYKLENDFVVKTCLADESDKMINFVALTK